MLCNGFVKISSFSKFKATKLMDHKRRYDLRREELEKRKNEEKVRKAREVYEQQKEVRTVLFCCNGLQGILSTVFSVRI